MKFGVREICNVTFKATDDRMIGNLLFKKYQPVFIIDTATTSEMTQESTTVYAQGGRGYNRLIAWEGEKAMTFTVTDALMSPMGMAVLSGAGLIKATEDNVVHVHMTIDAPIDTEGVTTITLDTLLEDLGLVGVTEVKVCSDTKIYATVLDGAGAGIDYISDTAIAVTAPTKVTPGDYYTVTKDQPLKIKVTGTDYMSKTAKFDFYVLFTGNASQIDIEPDSFGGNFYVEADTLFRRQDTGKDMAATLTFPLVKVQSGFTFTMAASGDPSTFDFVMDALPGYTQFDRTKKVCVAMAIVGADSTAAEDNGAHSDHKAASTPVAGE